VNQQPALEQAPYTCGHKRRKLAVDYEMGVVTVNDEVVTLAGRLYACLELFTEREGLDVTLKQIKALSPGVKSPKSKVAKVTVCELRRALDRFGLEGIIQTRRKIGYRLWPDDLGEPRPTAK